MRNRQHLAEVLFTSLLTFALFGLGGCVARKPITEWPEGYRIAVADASNPEPGEIVHSLVAIRQDNPGLTWKTIDGTAHVLMVTLTDTPQYYSDSLHGDYDTGSHFIWVTAVPEVRKRCSAADFGRDRLSRLRQLLGLPPGDFKSHFVEFWVRPGDLFRPAPDNEITDNTAGLNWPDHVEPWYRKWFNDLRAFQYHQSSVPKNDAYPWTQLGYTYDWGNGQSEVGVSEFVIKQHSRVVVETITPIEGYCFR